MIYQEQQGLNILPTTQKEGQTNSKYAHTEGIINEIPNTSTSSFFCREGVKERIKTHTLQPIDIIKALLRERGLKQSEFARSIGMTRQSFHNYIRGEWRPPAQIKLKIAQGLGVDSSTIWDFLETQE